MVTKPGKQNLREIGAGKPPENPGSVTITQLAAPAGGVGAAAGGWDTAANRDLAITSINAARTDIASLRTELQALGVLAE